MANDCSPHLKGEARSRANPGASPVTFNAKEAEQYNASVRKAESVRDFLGDNIPDGMTWKHLNVVTGTDFSSKCCLLKGALEDYRLWAAIKKDDPRLVDAFETSNDLAAHLGWQSAD